MHLGYHSSPSFGATPYLVTGIKTKKKTGKRRGNSAAIGREKAKEGNSPSDSSSFSSTQQQLQQEEEKIVDDSDMDNDDFQYENIMIDVPRYNAKLADIVESEGGLAKLIITHRDNMHDHEKWKDRFPNLQRVIHRSVSRCTECCVTVDF